jgi:hypothetical protein
MRLDTNGLLFLECPNLRALPSVEINGFIFKKRTVILSKYYLGNLRVSTLITQAFHF